MDLRVLAGNGPLKRQLEGEQAHRGLSHAYILAGPAGSGKRTLAGVLAAALFLGEPLDLPTLAGVALTLAGVFVSTRAA